MIVAARLREKMFVRKTVYFVEVCDNAVAGEDLRLKVLLGAANLFTHRVNQRVQAVNFLVQMKC